MTYEQSNPLHVRVEVVTSMFVAAGRPEGIHDLGRLLENLNNPMVSREIDLHEPEIRPLYRAGERLQLDAGLLIRREDIIFANFEGPYFMRGMSQIRQVDAPVLLLAPPFQIQGTIAVSAGVDPKQALRSLVRGFFVVRNARVFDADGAPLGEGEQIVVNADAVQMASATALHIPQSAALPARAVIEEIPRPDERRGKRRAA
jgi:hypothetical protein